MSRLPLRSTAAVGVEAARRKHIPDISVLNLDCVEKLTNRIGTRIPGGDGEGHLVLVDILKDRPYFWIRIRQSPPPVNYPVSLRNKRGDEFLAAIKRPQSIVTVKDD